MWTRIAATLCLAAALRAEAWPASEYCAVEVRIRNSSAEPVDTIVILEPKDGKKSATTSANGVARFCDVGLRDFKVVVGEACGQVTISGLKASPPSTRTVNVVYDRCASESPPGRTGCLVLLRIATRDGRPLARAALRTSSNVSRESDQYGRIFAMVRYGDSLRGTVKRDGYREQGVDVACHSDQTRLERSVDLAPASP